MLGVDVDDDGKSSKFGAVGEIVSYSLGFVAASIKAGLPRIVFLLLSRTLSFDTIKQNLWKNEYLYYKQKKNI